jgi:hypothetical protein
VLVLKGRNTIAIFLCKIQDQLNNRGIGSKYLGSVRVLKIGEKPLLESFVCSSGGAREQTAGLDSSFILFLVDECSMSLN